MNEKQIRQQMVSLGASLFNRGLSAGSGGNLSARLPDGNFLATPTGSCLGRLDADKLSRISASGELIAGDSPSKECVFHLEIYKARPECGAVAHLHSTYATALSCLKDINPEDVLRPFTPYYVMQVAPLPLVPYHKPGSGELFAAIAQYAAKARCLLLANHGMVATGKNLEDAVNKAEELEETAKLYMILKASGLEIRYLTDSEISMLKPAR